MENSGPGEDAENGLLCAEAAFVAARRAPELLMPAAGQAVANLALAELWWQAAGPALYARGAALLAVVLLAAAAYVFLFLEREGEPESRRPAFRALLAYVLAVALATGLAGGLLTLPVAGLASAGFYRVLLAWGSVLPRVTEFVTAALTIAAALGLPELAGGSVWGALRSGFERAARRPALVAALAAASIFVGIALAAAARALARFSAEAGPGAPPLVNAVFSFLFNWARLSILYGAPLLARRERAA